ncbi:MAG TPA: hypothetical protein VGJ84_16220 [Polyangiaceae bacterium]
MKSFHYLFHGCILAVLLGAGSACLGSRAPATAKDKSGEQQEHVAKAEDNGVTLVVKTDSMKDARILGVSIPVYVEVKNMSGKPIQIDRNAFGLQSRGGGESTSLDPEEVANSSYDEKPATMRKPPQANVQPQAGPPGPAGPGAGQPRPAGPMVFDPHDPNKPRDPKADNKKKWFDLIVGPALTAQVLEYGSTAHGFVYFKPVGEGREGARQQLIVTASLNDAKTAQAIAKFRIGVQTEGAPSEEGEGGGKKHGGGGGKRGGGGMGGGGPPR